MPISSSDRKAGPYLGNDVTTSFPFSFKVFSKNDLLVVLADANGDETTLTVDSDFTASLNADQDSNPGGDVVLPSALVTGTTLTITSDVQPTQQVDFTNQGGFYPRVLNTALDKLTVLIQQALEIASRSLKTAVSTPTGFNPQLPAPVPYAVIGWNADGTGFQNSDPTYSTALASDLASVSSGKGSSLVAYKSSLSGAVSETVYSVINDYVSVKRFGAKGDGTTDDTAAIQAALNAYRNVYFPPGDYKITAYITINNSYQNVKGAGAGTRIRPNGNFDCFRFASGVSACAITDIQFYPSVTQTSGNAINFTTTGVSDITLDNILCTNCWGGIISTATNVASGTAFVYDVHISNFRSFGTIYRGIQIQSAIGWKINKAVISFASPQTTQPATNSRAIMIDAWTDGLWMTDINALGGEYSLLAGNTWAGRDPAEIDCKDVNLDSGWFSSLYIANARRFRFKGGWIANLSAAATGGIGGIITTSSAFDIRFSGTAFVNCNKELLKLDTGCSQVRFIGCEFLNGSVSSDKTYNGVVVAAGVSQFSFFGCEFGNRPTDFGSNGQGYGLFIYSGASDNYAIIANKFSGNGTGPLIDGGTGTNVIVTANTGVSPSNSLPTVTASPYTYTAGHGRETVYVLGGTVSSIASNGTSLFTSTDRTIDLGPNETVTLTYTVAPTVKVFKH